MHDGCVPGLQAALWIHLFPCLLSPSPMVWEHSYNVVAQKCLPMCLPPPVCLPAVSQNPFLAARIHLSTYQVPLPPMVLRSMHIHVLPVSQHCHTALCTCLLACMPWSSSAMLRLWHLLHPNATMWQRGRPCSGMSYSNASTWWYNTPVYMPAISQGCQAHQVALWACLFVCLSCPRALTR